MSQTELFLHRLWDVLSGQYPPLAPRQIPVIASLFYYSLTLLNGRILRLLNKKYVPQQFQDITGDIIATFIGCACSLENCMLKQYYGPLAYAGILMFLIIWSSYIPDKGRGNPCENVIHYMDGKSSLKRVILRIALQTAAGFTSFQYAKLFWYLELSDGHGYRYRRVGLSCNSDLAIASPGGFLIEFGATLVETFVYMNIFSRFYFAELVTKATYSTVVVLMGVHLTGMYLNPINASQQTFGCRGTSAFEHILVYWVAPITATILAVVIQRHLGEIYKNMLWKDTTDMPQSQSTETLETGYEELSFPSSEKESNTPGKKSNKKNAKGPKNGDTKSVSSDRKGTNKEPKNSGVKVNGKQTRSKKLKDQ